VLRATVGRCGGDERPEWAGRVDRLALPNWAIHAARPQGGFEPVLDIAGYMTTH
jgi:hypothetical protein